jgi:poly(A) polymerase
MTAGETTAAAAEAVDGDWLRSATMRRLFAAFPAGTVRCVGGCVRDSLAGLKVKDVDLATSLTPDAMVERLKRAGIAVVPTGLKHGTVTAVVDHVPYEITTLRRDVETDGRHARVAFTDDWHADAARRDLTINAIYCDPDGRLFDPFGGAADIAAGHVRFVGDPRERIQEDFLRLLRFFRFQARFGHGAPDAEALAACRELAPGLVRLSAERVHDEIIKLLAGPRVAETVALMAEAGLLAHANPGLRNVDRLARLIAVEAQAAERLAGVRPDPIRRLAALLDETDAAARARLRLSNREQARINAVYRREPPAMSARMTAVRARQLIYDLGPERFRDRCLMAWAADPAANAEGWLQQLAEADRWTAPEFPLTGRDVLALGIESGPAVGSLLGRVRRWWREGGFAADRDSCLAQLAEAARKATLTM